MHQSLLLPISGIFQGSVGLLFASTGKGITRPRWGALLGYRIQKLTPRRAGIRAGHVEYQYGQANIKLIPGGKGMFRPARARKVFEDIVDQVTHLIAEGKLKPGDKLMSERELAQVLDASRSSVREALRVLEMLGIVEGGPGEGTFIRKVSLENITTPLAALLVRDAYDTMKLFEVRKILEVECSALAAERAGQEDLRKINEILQKMANTTDENLLTELDLSFHLAIYEATQNHILVEIMSMISDLLRQTMGWVRRRIYLLPGGPETLLRQHQSIYEQLVRRDQYGARQSAFAHLQYAEEQTRRMVFADKPRTVDTKSES